MRRLLLAPGLALLPALAAFPADNPWVGTWRLDPSKSHSAGFTITYSKSESGAYHFTAGDGEGFDLGFEGKEYDVGNGYTISQTMAGENGWDSVWKHNGQVTTKDHGQISQDGKTLTITTHPVRPDGSTVTEVRVLSRVSGTMGPVGTWKTIKMTEAPYTLVVTLPSEGVMRWESPEFKQAVEGKTDGSDLPVTGPEEPAGETEAITIPSPRKLSYTVKVNGKPSQQGIKTLSADGKSLTDVSWIAGKESEKSTEVFERQ